MRQVIKKYIDTIDEGSVIISCPDCFSVNEILSSSGHICFNTLANMVETGNQTHIDYVKAFIENGSCNHVVIIGHLHCHVIRHALSGYEDKGVMKNIGTYMRNLEGLISIVLWDRNKDAERRFMHYHVACQVNRLASISYFREKIRTNQITVSGLFVDEERFEIEEIDAGILENIFAFLN